MRFTLHYSGQLPVNGSRDEKHAIRRALHVQLAELWKHPPLAGMDALRQPRQPGVGHGANVDGVWRPTGQGEGSYNSVRKVGPFSFVPLATEEMNLIAALEVVMLRPEPAGRLITQGGDIDNRLKTLFDALTKPQPNALPDGAQPAADENPFYVVFEDDNLITSISVQTEHLLKPNHARHVELFLRVQLTATSPTFGNISMAL
jgi:hypothetical protein